MSFPDTELEQTKECFLKQAPKFTIEDGIIKGEKYSYSNDGHSNFGEYLLEKMKNNPNFVAQVDDKNGIEDTCKDIADRSVRLALWLNDQNLQPDDIIGMCTNNQVNTIVTCLASLYIGRIFYSWRDYLVREDLMRKEMRFALNLGKPKIVFTNEEFAEMVKEAAISENMDIKIIIFGRATGFESFDDIIGKQEEKRVEEFRCVQLVNSKHPAMINYTSGSTGIPKGVLHSHEALFGNAAFTSQCFGNCNTAIWYSKSSWISGTRNLFASLASMKKNILADVFSVEDFARLVRKYKIDWVWVTPNTARSLVTSEAFSKYDMSSIKYFSIGGSILPERTQKAIMDALPNANVVNRYGSTETGGTVILQTDSHNIKPLGTIVRNIEMKVVDPKTGKILGPNEQGEGCFKSPFMMMKYYNHPEYTKAALDSDGWLHTKELFYYEENGFIHFCGRMKSVIKVKNYDVSPEIVEQVILSHPGVRDCGVAGTPTPDGHELLAAFIVKSPDSNTTEDDIIKLVEEKLPKQMWLEGGVKFLESLPRTVSGKANRSELKQILLAHCAFPDCARINGFIILAGCMGAYFRVVHE